MALAVRRTPSERTRSTLRHECDTSGARHPEITRGRRAVKSVEQTS